MPMRIDLRSRYLIADIVHSAAHHFLRLSRPHYQRLQGKMCKEDAICEKILKAKLAYEAAAGVIAGCVNKRKLGHPCLWMIP